MPEIGERLPNFDLPQNSGVEVSSSELLGQNLVLFFYPRDDTSGCTVESIGFSERLGDFAKCNTAVYGVSKDSVKSHDKFANKHFLKVPLLSDEHGTLCEDLGVWKEKKMYGKTFMGIERTTFIADPQGIITHVWHKVKVPGHVEEVLETVKNL